MSNNQTATNTYDDIRKKFAAIALLVLICALAGFGGGWYGSEARQDLKTNQASQQIIASESQLISQLAKKVGPSVVSVNVTTETTRPSFFGPTLSQERSAGTGIILNAQGVVVTNRHVIPAGSPKVTITLSDGTELEGVEVIGRTSDSDSLDIAFLKIVDAKGKKLSPAKLGDSSKVEVGDKIIAIGNALGQFQNTVTAGIVSGYGRSVLAGDESGGASETLQNLFQTDAAINQGNSGGPLVNMNGEVIGINTAVAGGLAENIGFAIPLDDIKGLIRSVLTNGKLERPFLGIRYITLTDAAAFKNNLSTKRGAYISSQDGQSPIIPDSPAARAGLRDKDIIIKVDGTTIDENHSLTSLIGRKSVGEETALTISREGKEQIIKVKLDSYPVD